jgi:hypothetical protein
MRKRYLSSLSLVLALAFLNSFFVQADEAKLMFPESHKRFTLVSSRSGIAIPESLGIAGPFNLHGNPGPPPRIGPNIQVNDAQTFPFGRSETTIAVSGNGKRMVIGWNDAQGFCGPPFPIPLGCEIEIPGFSGYGYSNDGGNSFVDGGAPPLGNRVGFGPGPGDISESGVYITLGDPTLDVGGRGNDTFFYANLAEFVDQDHVFFGSDPSAGIVVHIGKFNNHSTFSWTEAVLLQSPNYPRDFLDKEFIAADKRGNSKHVYVSVTNLIEVNSIPFFGFGQIDVYASADGGKTWSRSIVQPDETISVDENSGIINQGSQPAAAPDGTVYVAWERGWLSPFFGQATAGVYPQIRVAVSHDSGLSWSPAASGAPFSGVNPAGVLVSNICSGALFPPVGYNRSSSNDFPRIAVAQSGPQRGRVYVVWNDCRIANGGTQAQTGGVGDSDTDIYLAYSDNHGMTWSSPVLVAGGGDGSIQFWPTVSIQPGGNVDITYYESAEIDLDPQNDQECVVPLGPGGTPPFRISPMSSLVDLYYVQSTDGGMTFSSPIRVTEETTNWCDAISNIVPNFGDYNTAVSAGNRLFATWADGRNRVPDVFFAEILTRGKAPK